MLSYCLLGLQLFVIVTMISGNFIKQTFPMIPPKIIDIIQENKITSGILMFFGGNILSGMITNNGAFEIFVNNKMVWSKLSSGKVPNIQGIESLITRNGFNLS